MKKFNLWILSAALVMTSVSCESGISDDNNKDFVAGDMTGIIEEKTITVLDMITIIMEAFPDVNPTGPDDAGIDYPKLLSLLKDIHIAKIKYMTPSPDGKLIEASGLVAYPEKLQEYSHILSLQHGTNDINGGPSDQKFPIEGCPVFADEVVVMADYLGYGISKTSDLRHTYLNINTTGSCCADMILAARQYLKTKNSLKCTADSIRLIGYSQGGQATIATLFELERRRMDDQISLVWSGGGPHDLLEFIKDPDKEYDHISTMIFGMMGIIEGDMLDVKLENLLSPEFISSGKDSIITKCQLSEWDSIVGTHIKEVLHPDFFKENYGGNSDVKILMDHFRSNSTVNISQPVPPNVHIRFYHAPADSYVPYQCSVSAQEHWKSCSELIDLKAAKNHVGGGLEFFIEYMGPEFDMLRELIPLVEQILN